MKALRIEKYSKDFSGLSVGEVERPQAGHGEVLVRVKAASLNPVDLQTIRGETKMMLPVAPPMVVGVDVAGVVESVGEGVRRWKPGQEVMGFVGIHRPRTIAQFAVVSADALALKPEGVSWQEAGAAPLASLCAYQGLAQMGVEEGKRVLVHAGVGGVGSMAVQIAVARGADVVTTVSTRSLEQASRFGAKQLVDYRKERFEDVVGPVDAVFDTVGGDTLKRSMKVVKAGGSVGSVHALPSAEVLRQAGLKIPSLMSPLLWAMGVGPRRSAAKAGASLECVVTVPDGEGMGQVAALMGRGELKVLIDRTFELEQAREAVMYLASGDKRRPGKVVVVMP